MTPVVRTLVVMRHARAESTGPTDAERALAARGVQDAGAAGRWLAAAGVAPDAALVSAATRTRQTWQHVAAGAGWTLDPTLDRGLYQADDDTALDLLRGQDDAVGTLLLLGHNPTVGALAQLLDDGEGDVEAGNQMALGFATCAAAVLDVRGSWRDLDPGTARLRAYHVGRA